MILFSYDNASYSYILVTYVYFDNYFKAINYNLLILGKK